MKPLFNILLLIACTACASYSQDLSSATLSALRTNMVVPDLPAFKSLSTEPSNLLRPSTPQAFATSLSEFYSGGKIIVPAAFAAEITPAQLLNARRPLTELREYARNSVLNSFRISAGTARDTISNSGRSLALGARINLINGGELFTDINYTTAVIAALQGFGKDAMELRKRFAESKDIDTSSKAAVPWDEALDTHPRWKTEWKKEYDSLEADANTFAGQRQFMTRIEAIREDYRRRHWNDERLDLAVAVSSASPDSLLANIRFRRADVWMTYAMPALNRRGQLLVGFNANVARGQLDDFSVGNEDAHFNFSLPARLLIGTNRVKGFGELQYSYVGLENAHKAFFNLGTELNIIDGVWVNFYAGVDYNTTAEVGTFKTNLDLKLTLPENFSLF